MFSHSNHKSIIFPEGKKFAFTIFDDTDRATVANVQPVYSLLKELQILTTKSVWVFPSRVNSLNDGETLEDKDYLNFIKDLDKNGFEIALHGVSADSSRRERTIFGIEQFNKLLGFYPTSCCAHLNNQENLYWDKSRLSSSLIKSLLVLYKRQKKGYFQGQIENSPYFWGDICQKYIRYVRNFTFKEINLFKINPTLPYHDPKKPYVPFWFSSSDCLGVKEFNKTLSLSNQERLAKENGICIIYTHFALGFVKNGKINSETKKLLEALAEKQGWFVPLTQLLDYLREQKRDLIIPNSELRKMEWRWLFEKGLEKPFRKLKYSNKSNKHGT